MIICIHVCIYIYSSIQQSCEDFAFVNRGIYEYLIDFVFRRIYTKFFLLKMTGKMH